MKIADLDITIEVSTSEACFVIYQSDNLVADINFTLRELEEFQGRLAIAAAKLRGNLAKEATGQ